METKKNTENYSILIKTVRISNFRCLKNIEVDLEQITILTGLNNSGKTSFLKAMQLALGNRQFVTQDDFFIQDGVESDQITIDTLIIPIKDGVRCNEFSIDGESLLTTERIRLDDRGAYVPLRTIITFDPNKNSYKPDQYILHSWCPFKNQDDETDWFAFENMKKTDFYFEELPFFYIDAQRDILDDIKSKYSYLRRVLSKLEYLEDPTIEIEAQIELLNKKLINNNPILSLLNKTLKDLDTAMDTHGGVEITPFTKKLRDLNKHLSIYYTHHQDSFSMEYQGMGTRSWSSLLTLKTFIAVYAVFNRSSLFVPIIAIEEPETHLHPNAQKKLYKQINEMTGQKIISTHSSYIAASAKLAQIRNFYRNDNIISCGKIILEKDEDIRKIERQVIKTRGEIFFSKFLVFFEGETEEQALPIFAEKYFKQKPFEMGVDFIGVGGYGNYLPFLRFAEALKIPWIIFSDAEIDAIKEVTKQIKNCKTLKKDVVIFLDNGNDFEAQLICDGFSDEIKQLCKHLYGDNYLTKSSKKKKRKKLNNLKDGDGLKQSLYDCITSEKTQFAPIIAEQIVHSNKDLPPKVIELFKKIDSILKIRKNTHDAPN